MPINLSKMPKRFDAALAKAGVAHRITDKSGNYYGTYITALFDPSSKFIQMEYQKFNRMAKSGKNPAAVGKHADIYAFVQICLKDWKDVPFTDENDKPLKFSKETAFDLLTMESEDEDEQNVLNWLRNEIISVSKDESNYQGDPDAEKGEAAGN